MSERAATGIRPWVAVAVTGALSLASACTSSSSPSSSDRDGAAVVVEVIDGDTVIVDVGGREESVRLIGVDTPETRHPERPVECYGPEATEFTESLLPRGTPVRLERDIENRDDYGRLLGYVFRANDDVFVNYELVRNGFAVPLSIEPNVTHASLFVEAARAAEAADTGLWAVCAG